VFYEEEREREREGGKEREIDIFWKVFSLILLCAGV
jgi:hypothetical protein